MRRLTPSTLMTLLSIAAACVVAEGVLRTGVVDVPPVYESYQFVQRPADFRDQHVAFGFTPSAPYREAALHARSNDAVLEYDVTFRANNAGLVQRQDIVGASPYTVVVGDSFTQGAGASPWFYDLERGSPDLPLANLGIGGTGVTHWTHALHWFEEAHAPVRHVVVIFITDDFLRPYWQASASEDGLSLCYEKACRLVASPYRPDGPDALLINAQRHALRAASWSEALKREARTFLARFRIGELAINVGRRLRGHSAAEREFLAVNKVSWAELAGRYHVLFALHLPQKEEARARQWTALSREVHAFVAESGVRTIDGLSACGLGAEDFFPRDIHPNATGYGKIRRCLESLLRNVPDLEAAVPSG